MKARTDCEEKGMSFSGCQWCIFFLLLLLFHVSSSRAQFHTEAGPTENSLASIDVGVILDNGSTVGIASDTCFSMAVDDINATPGRRRRLVVHKRNSDGTETGIASAALNLIKEAKVQAIVGPYTSELAHFLGYMANQAHIPTISFSPIVSSQSPYVISMAPNESSQASAIAAIVKAYAWRDVVLVHDDTFSGTSLLPHLIDALESTGTHLHQRLMISHTANEDTIRDTLRMLAAMSTRVFLVHVSFSVGNKLFVLAHEVGMMRNGYVWLITPHLANLLNYMNYSAIDSMQGVLGVKTYVSKSSTLHDFRTRWKRQFQKEHPKIDVPDIDVNALWAYDAMWIIAIAVERTSLRYNGSFQSHPSNPMDLFDLGVSLNGPRLLQSILKTRFTGLSREIHLMDGQFQSSNFEVVNVVGKCGRRIGYWTPKIGLSQSIVMDKNYSANIEDLAGVIWPGGSTAVPKGQINLSRSPQRLRIGVPIKTGFSEFMKVTRHNSDKRFEPTGFPVDVFIGVMNTLPHKVEYDFFPYQNGHEDDAGYYNELIYQVYLKIYDAVVGDTTINANRSNYVEFTQPFVDSEITMIVPVKNDDETKSAWWFLKPLTKEMWFVTIALFVFKGILIWVFEHNVNPEFQGSFSDQIGKVISFSFSTLVFANREKLESNYSRFVMNLWTFVVLILVTSFTANLTSILTVEKLKPSITDMKSLIKNGEYVGYQNGSFVFDFLREQGFQESKLRAYDTREKYAQALLKGSGKDGVSAIVDETPYLRVVLQKYCGKFTLAGRTYRTGGFGFVFPKGSPMVRDVSSAILKFTEGNGMFDVEKKWFGDETTCPDPLQTPAANVDVHLYPLYIVAAVSSSLALSVYVVYCLYKRAKDGNTQPNLTPDDAASVEQRPNPTSGETIPDKGERNEDHTNIVEDFSVNGGERNNDQVGPSSHLKAVEMTPSRNASEIISDEEHRNVGPKN